MKQPSCDIHEMHDGTYSVTGYSLPGAIGIELGTHRTLRKARKVARQWVEERKPPRRFVERVQ